MDHRTDHPPGSPKDILVRMNRLERDIAQQLRDVQSVNDNNPNFADRPIDTGRYLVQLKKTREVVAAVQREVDNGSAKLPDGILDPINEAW